MCCTKTALSSCCTLQLLSISVSHLHEIFTFYFTWVVYRAKKGAAGMCKRVIGSILELEAQDPELFSSCLLISMLSQLRTGSPCVLSSPAWLSSLPGDRCPSSAAPGTSCLPAGCPCRRSPPTARLWSLASSAPLSGRSCCCSLWAASGWRHLCSNVGRESGLPSRLRLIYLLCCDRNTIILCRSSLPGLWLGRWALYCHLWRGGLLCDGGGLGRRSCGCDGNRRGRLVFLRLICFVRLI